MKPAKKVCISPDIVFHKQNQKDSSYVAPFKNLNLQKCTNKESDKLENKNTDNVFMKLLEKNDDNLEGEDEK